MSIARQLCILHSSGDIQVF